MNLKSILNDAVLMNKKNKAKGKKKFDTMIIKSRKEKTKVDNKKMPIQQLLKQHMHWFLGIYYFLQLFMQ